MRASHTCQAGEQVQQIEQQLSGLLANRRDRVGPQRLHKLDQIRQPALEVLPQLPHKRRQVWHRIGVAVVQHEQHGRHHLPPAASCCHNS